MNRQGVFEKEIKAITEQIVKKYKPEKIILYGSAARGDFDQDSDIDMLIIKKSHKSRPERATDVYRLIWDLDRTLPFEPLVFTPQELERQLKLGDPFFLTILKEGKILHGKGL